jgi:hypothetical protein
MLSSVLRSERAVQVNIEITRAFVRLSSNPVNDWNGAKRLNGWNGLQLKVHGATRAEEKEGRLSGRRKGCCLRPAVAAAHFDVLTIIKTCNSSSESGLEQLNFELLNGIFPVTTHAHGPYPLAFCLHPSHLTPVRSLVRSPVIPVK